jgi:NADH-quinone oxidoreductase subunit J
MMLFYMFAAVAILASLLVIGQRNPIYSVLLLIASFGALSGLYVLLDAPFVAVIQIVVYAGAIMVLFLFVIMLLNLGHDYQSDLRGGLWIVWGFTVAGIIGFILSRVFITTDPLDTGRGGMILDAALQEQNAVGVIAQPLFRDFLIPFELTSVLLLVAIIGAVLLAKRRV